MVNNMMFDEININNEITGISTDSIIIEKEFLEELKNYNKNRMNKLNKEEYRNRINKLYNDIGMIKPIDNEINDIIYFDSYDEAGLVLNKKDVSLKQIWTEYRLIYNEKEKENEEVMENSFVLDNFDELFDRISKKVDGLDSYINDLNSLKKEIDVDSNRLKNDKESLEIDKINFDNYRREEIARLEKKEKELNIRLDKLNKLMIVFNKKLEEFFNNDKDTL